MPFITLFIATFEKKNTSKTFSGLNAAIALQLFSIKKNAAALEKAVVLKQIYKNALRTAWWIKIVLK